MSVRIWPTMALAQANAARTATAPLVWDPVNHLLTRCTFGPTTAGRAALSASGPDAWYAAQLVAGRALQGCAGNPVVAAQSPLLSLTPFDVRATLAANGQSLNLAESTKAAVNENYGRELLEMHTVGRIYAERDVTNAATLLTGRTLDDNFHYLYDSDIHGTGKVTVLGFTSQNATAAGARRPVGSPGSLFPGYAINPLGVATTV